MFRINELTEKIYYTNYSVNLARSSWQTDSGLALTALIIRVGKPGKFTGFAVSLLFYI